MYNFAPKCNIDKHIEPEIVVGDDGVTRYVYTTECSDCDFKVVVKKWQVQNSVCETTDYYQMYLAYGEEAIVNIIRTSVSSNHNWEKSYEFMGSSCTEGVKVTEYCDICGVTSTYTTYGHMQYENMVNSILNRKIIMYKHNYHA